MTNDFPVQRQPELAFRDSETIHTAQLELLRRHVDYLVQQSPYYSQLLGKAGLDSSTLTSLDDLARFPLTDKSTLETSQLGMLCTPERDIRDVCLTSGTTGKPISLLQTGADLERLAYNEECSFRSAGITADDRVLIAAAIDRCFMAGLAYFLGLNRVGAATIRGGSSSIPVLAELVRSQKPTALVGVPSLLIAVAEYLQHDGASPGKLGVTRILCIGEPVRTPDLELSPLGKRLSETWQATVFGTYASTEMATAFTDCEAGQGGHVLPDLMIVEVVDDQGRPLPAGTAGEVVATPLQVSGMPLLRYRTGDLAMLHDGPCHCGRNTPRLGPIIGRKAQMLKVRGTTLYPPAVFSALQEIPSVQASYLEVRSDYDLSDKLTVVVGSSDPILTPDLVAEKIASKTRVKPEVKIVSAEEVRNRTMVTDKRKPVTFFDLRDSTQN